MRQILRSPKDAHMRQRRHGWFAQLAIPKHIRPAFGGKASLEKSLATQSIKEARIRRDQTILAWRKEFRALDTIRTYTPEALKQVRASTPMNDQKKAIAFDLLRAERMRATHEWHWEKSWRDDGEVQARQLEYYFMDDDEISKLLVPQGLEPTRENMSIAAAVISEADEVALKLFSQSQINLPITSLEPIESPLETFFLEKALRPRQQVFYRRTIQALVNWMKEKNLSPVIGKVTPQVAGQFVTDRHIPRQREAKSVNNEVSALSSYWNFLCHKKGKIAFNAFERKSIERRHVKSVSIRKRKFSDEEMIKLLEGDPSRLLKDCIKLLALHGMRAEELCQLRVGDCKKGVFRIYGGGDPDRTPSWHDGKLGKNERARRDIPIHSSVLDIVNRRRAKKEETDFLIYELGDPKWERSQVLSRDFRNYRKSLGVHEPDRKQSRVDLHSLRRWFIWAAGDALTTGKSGYTAWTIADVAGHDTESSMPLGMTMGLYAGTADLETKRKCIEAVKLPARLTS